MQLHLQDEPLTWSIFKMFMVFLLQCFRESFYIWFLHICLTCSSCNFVGVSGAGEFKSMCILGAPEWFSQLGIWLLILAQVMISWLWDRVPSWAVCWAWSLLGILSSSPSCPAHTHVCAHSVSLKNIFKIKINLKKSLNFHR